MCHELLILQSFDDVALTFTVKESIYGIFDHLERRYGRLVVFRTANYITASSTGLLDDELESILSMDSQIMKVGQSVT